MTIERYDRQARIPDWDQERLDKAVLTIIGDNAFSRCLAGSAAQLGVGRIRVLSSALDPVKGQDGVYNLHFGDDKKSDLEAFIGLINPLVRLEEYETPFVVPPETFFLEGSSFLVNASQRYSSIGLTGVYAFERSLPFEMVRFHGDGGVGSSFIGVNHGDPSPQRLERYRQQQIEEIDEIMAICAAGAGLEEIKRGLFGQEPDRKRFSYDLSVKPGVTDYSKFKACVIGAGALGNEVMTMLALLGVSRVNLFDADVIDSTNLGRQLWFYGRVGEPKAKVLAERAKAIVDATLRRTQEKGIMGVFNRGPKYQGIQEMFTEKTKLAGAGYDVVFDCVDNFEARLIISRSCAKHGVPLISGGTNYHSGQVVAQVPKKTTCVRHALDLDRLAEIRRKEQAKPQGCIAQPDPSVIMSNQVTAALMVQAFRTLVDPGRFGPVFNGIVKYDASSPFRFGNAELADACGDDSGCGD